MQRSSRIITINPTCMNVNDSYFLFHALQQLASNQLSYFPKDTVIELATPINITQTSASNEVSYYLSLTHTLTRRQSNRHPKEDRYEIYGEEIGRGGFGQVSKIIGTLYAENEQLIFKDHVKRVVKMMTAAPHVSIEMLKTAANQEYNIAKRNPTLSVKQPTFFKDPSTDLLTSMMVMRYVPGDDLEKLIKNDQANKKININDIKTDTRIKLIIAIAQAMEQLHKENVVHSDIKPSNIRISIRYPECEEPGSPLLVKATIIDFGGSFDRNQTLTQVIYTPLFAAPEVLDGCRPSQHSDTFSIGEIAGLLMRADYHPSQLLMMEQNEKDHQSKQPLSSRIRTIYAKKISKTIMTAAHNYQFKNLFFSMNDLKPSHRIQIADLLKNLCSSHSHQRGSAADIVNLFERISLERAMDKIPTPAKHDQAGQELYLKKQAIVIKAHEIGIQLHHDLKNQCKDISSDYQKSFSNLKKIREKFFQECESLDITCYPDAISIIIERLNIHTLVGLKSMREISQKITQIVFEFAEILNKTANLQHTIQITLSDMNEKIQQTNDSSFNNELRPQIAQLARLEQELKAFENRLHEAIDIDKLNLSNTKLSERLKKIHDEILLQREQIQSIYQKHNSLRYKVTSLFALTNLHSPSPLSSASAAASAANPSTTLGNPEEDEVANCCTM